MRLYESGIVCVGGRHTVHNLVAWVASATQAQNGRQGRPHRKGPAEQLIDCTRHTAAISPLAVAASKQPDAYMPKYSWARWHNSLTDGKHLIRPPNQRGLCVGDAGETSRCKLRSCRA